MLTLILTFYFIYHTEDGTLKLVSIFPHKLLFEFIFMLYYKCQNGLIN